jgi:hypothetical protein
VKIVLAAAIVFLAYWGCTRATDGSIVTYDLRWRLTMEIDTPAGVRSGSAVMKSHFYKTWGNSVGEMRGEAVFADLGGGRHVIALLVHGPRGEDSGNQMPALAVTAMTGEPWGSGAYQALEKRWGRLSGSAELKRELIPTLVTFTDLANPATAKVVPPTAEGFAAAFGPGFAFKRATVEIVPGGILPFSLIPLGWPQWLFGAPVTRGIEARLPWYGRVTFDQMRNPDGSTLSLEQRQYWATILGSFVRKQ